MNPANRLGGVVAVTVVTFLSLAGVVLGAAFIVDNTTSDDYTDMETVEAMIGEDESSGWVEFGPYYEYASDEDIPDFEFGAYAFDDRPRFRFYLHDDRFREDWRNDESPRLFGFLRPSDSFDGYDRSDDHIDEEYLDELMEGLFQDRESFDALEPEFEERFREMLQHLVEEFETDEFYLYEYDEEEDE